MGKCVAVSLVFVLYGLSISKCPSVCVWICLLPWQLGARFDTSFQGLFICAIIYPDTLVLSWSHIQLVTQLVTCVCVFPLCDFPQCIIQLAALACSLCRESHFLPHVCVSTGGIVCVPNTVLTSSLIRLFSSSSSSVISLCTSVTVFL